MRLRSVLTIGLLSASALSLPAWSQAARIYCCDDKDGRKVCGDFLPKECERRAYEERDAKGYVVNRVEAPLTPEQQARRVAELEQKQADEKRKDEDRRRNMALLSTYASEADIDTARDRSLAEIEKLIKIGEQGVAEADKALAKGNSEKEFYKGKALPAELKSKLRVLEANAGAKRAALAARKRDIDDTTAKFAEEHKRYRELKGLSATPSPAEVPAKPAAAPATPAPAEKK